MYTVVHYGLRESALWHTRCRPGRHYVCDCLPQAQKVRITATDLLGREVATLVAGETVSAGAHTVQFNAAGLASGTYLIRMDAGSFVATQRVTLLK